MFCHSCVPLKSLEKWDQKFVARYLTGPRWRALESTHSPIFLHQWQNQALWPTVYRMYENLSPSMRYAISTEEGLFSSEGVLNWAGTWQVHWFVACSTFAYEKLIYIYLLSRVRVAAGSQPIYKALIVFTFKAFLPFQGTFQVTIYEPFRYFNFYDQICFRHPLFHPIIASSV